MENISIMYRAKLEAGLIGLTYFMVEMHWGGRTAHLDAIILNRDYSVCCTASTQRDYYKVVLSVDCD